jgi:hypothetical protein
MATTVRRILTKLCFPLFSIPFSMPFCSCRLDAARHGRGPRARRLGYLAMTWRGSQGPLRWSSGPGCSVDSHWSITPRDVHSCQGMWLAWPHWTQPRRAPDTRPAPSIPTFSLVAFPATPCYGSQGRTHSLSLRFLCYHREQVDLTVTLNLHTTTHTTPRRHQRTATRALV